MNDLDPIKFLGRHLVCIAGWYYPTALNELQKGKEQFFAYAGVIISIKGNWSLLTAGHIIENLIHIEESVTAESSKVQYQLIDYFGKDSKSDYPIPFVFSKARRAYIFEPDKGIDFGLVNIDEYYQGLLEINGVIPITEEYYKDRDQEKYNLYVMLGFPKKLLEKGLQFESRGEIRLSGKITPILINVEKLNSLLEDLPQKEYPRFIGRVNKNYSLRDLDGMSGGPIFGISKDGGDYWISAIQSSFLEDRGIIFATPIPLIGAILEKSFELSRTSI